MLITTCAQCKARFRVTPQQLNARQGQVRCGRCRAVFNGFEALERFPDDDTGARLLAAREAEAQRNEMLAGIETLPDEDDLPSIAQAEPDAVPAQPMVEPPAAPSTPHRASIAKPGTPRAREIDLLLEPPPPKRLPRAWSFGVALLVFVLGIELTFAFRASIAQRYPAVRPVMEAVCARVQCSVPWSREETLLKLEESEMLEVPGKPSEIALGARIRNLAGVAQEFPHLELTLTDFTGQAAARRVLRPTDYLGRPVAPGEVLAPGSEVALQMRLETPRIKATGYELLLFYP
jgi:predicted Zn finger-like uncharacterized protein